MVFLFSKTNDTRSPITRRRFFLYSMISRRSWSRTFSYAPNPIRSSITIFSTGLILFLVEPVSALQDLDGVNRFALQRLLDLQGGERTVGNRQVGIAAANFAQERLSHFEREIEILSF